ncbi:amino acid adenylation domain-containing protein [Leptothoe sp. ISB3NOV94-8A]
MNSPSVLVSLYQENDYQGLKSDNQWLDLWQHRIEALPLAPELPLSRNLDKLNPKLIQYSHQVDSATWLRLREQTVQSGLMPSEIVLASYVEVLTAWSKNSHFTINVVEQLAPDIGAKAEFGLAANQFKPGNNSFTLLEINHSASDSFGNKARHIATRLRDNPKHRSEVQFQQLTSLSENSLEKLKSILATSFFIEPTEIKKDVATKNDIAVPAVTVPAHLECRYREENNTLTISLNVDEGLFPPGMAKDMLVSLCHLLQRLAYEEDIWHANTLQMIPCTQLEQRDTVNETSTSLSEETLYSLFVTRVQQQGESIAIVTPKQSFTYEILYQRISQLGHYLRQLDVRPNHLIAIVMEKGWEQIVAVLGILAAGAAYVPVDPELPPERFQYLLENSGVDIAITQSWLDEKLSWPSSIRRLALDQEHFHQGNYSQLSLIQSPDDLAYVIYTSGSTGLPKGVMVTHRNVVNVVIHTNQLFQVNSRDRVLALTALNHDLSVYDIFGPLVAGGTIVMPDAAAVKFSRHWLDLLIKERVTLWNSVPAMMEMLVNYLDITSEKLPRSLRLAILGGDWLPVSLVNRLKALSPDLSILSIGGPTETTIWNIGYLIRSVNPDWKSIPYGKPMANSKYYILNDNLEDCPVWVPGEMYCAGVQLARGYWRNYEKTAANFINHPRTGERIYRTGDLGCYLPDGNIEFLGRVDFQIKLRGYRIEAGEIEAVLTEYPSIQNAVVTVAETQQHQKYLTAYIILHRGHVLNIEEVRSFLEKKLPSYMVPSDFQVLDVFPLTANGKVDRLMLSQGKITR